ncbi:hypothetical protein AALK46_12625 [Staphylococcus nepalensis]|uniref:hypothetical protein n=1 Tax=Staphylococcus nepalensis TaxID=214473 RepID=UPI003518ECC2
MNNIQTIIERIILNPIVYTIILIGISISAVIGIILVFQGIKKVVAYNANVKRVISNKESIVQIILAVSIIYISQYLITQGNNSGVLKAMTIISTIVFGSHSFSLIIFVTRKVIHHLDQEKKNK